MREKGIAISRASLSAAERRAIEAVARHVGAAWEAGAEPPGAVLTVAGRRIAVTVAAHPARGAPSPPPAQARLRDDRVAQRVLSALDAAIAAGGPEGRTVVLTLGAPIRRANQTLAALASMLLDRLADKDSHGDEQADILGNRVRFRIVEARAVWTAKLAGFVFTDDPGPGDLARDIQALWDTIVAQAADDRPSGCDARWLVLMAGRTMVDARTYRRAVSRLALPEGFEAILMVSGGGRVEALVG